MTHIQHRSGGYAWYVASVLCVVHIIAFLDRYLIGLVSEPLKASMHLTDTQLGLLQGTGFVILYAIAAVPLGWVADLTNRRNLIIGGIAVWSLATVAAAFCSTFETLFITRLFVGIGEACLIPAAMSLLASYFVKSELSRGVAVFGMGAFLGQATAFLGGGALLGYLASRGMSDILPGIGVSAPWQGIFFFAGTLGLLIIPVLMTMREPARSPDTHEGSGSRIHGFGEGLRYIARHRGAYAVQIGCTTLVATTGYAATAWAISIFVRAHGLTVPQAGALVGSISLISGPAGNLIGGWFTDRAIARNIKGPTPYVLGIAMLMALGPALLFCLSPAIVPAAIGYGLLCFSTTFPLPAAYGGVQLLTPERYRGIAASVSLLCYTIIALGFGPPSVGFLTDHLFQDPHSLPYALLLLVIVIAAMGIPLAFLGRTRFQRSMLA